MKKIIVVLLTLLFFTGCSNSQSQDVKELELLLENVTISSLNSNSEINALYDKIEQINGNSKLFIEKKTKIIDELKDQAIEIWENEIVKAIENKQWNSYFDFRESIVFKDYYYWFSDELFYYNKESLSDYMTENKFVSCDSLLSHIQVEQGYFLVADIKFEEIYTLTQYLSLYSFSNTVFPNNPPYTDFAIETWQYDLSNINPNYSGKMADTIKDFAIEIYGSEEEWQKRYTSPKTYWTGNVEHYYFATLDEINNQNIEKLGSDKVESLKKSELEVAENKYNNYIVNKDNNVNIGTNNQQQNISKGFVLQNSKLVTDKEILAKCWTIATEEVKDNLKSPSSAKFPFSAISEDVEILQDRNYYCVHGWVEAENSYGTRIKSDFIVLIEEKSGKFVAYDCAIN